MSSKNIIPVALMSIQMQDRSCASSGRDGKMKQPKHLIKDFGYFDGLASVVRSQADINRLRDEQARQAGRKTYVAGYDAKSTTRVHHDNLGQYKLDVYITPAQLLDFISGESWRASAVDKDGNIVRRLESRPMKSTPMTGAVFGDDRRRLRAMLSGDPGQLFYRIQTVWINADQDGNAAPNVVVSPVWANNEQHAAELARKAAQQSMAIFIDDDGDLMVDLNHMDLATR